MYQGIAKTSYSSQDKPVMIWDGQCGFCKYWITVWKSKTGKNICYATFQDVATSYPDIPEKDFRDAVMLIEPDGKVYRGSHAAFRTMLYFKNPVGIWYRFYDKNNLFRGLSDWSYFFITKNRSFMLTLTILMFGSNPENRQSYWLWYLSAMILALIFLMLYYV